MSFNGTSVGLDVHALSVVAHAVDEETGRVERARLCLCLNYPRFCSYVGARAGFGWLAGCEAPVRAASYSAGG